MLLLLPLFLFIVGVHGCGMHVHWEVARRALHEIEVVQQNPLLTKYSGIVREYSHQMYSGALFPDWGYQCFGNDASAEYAHWPNFTHAAVDYIREKYPQPYDDYAKGLVAFVFGIVAHQVADANWHSIDQSDGLIRVMADLNFLGDYPSAHLAADLGGEFLLGRIVDYDFTMKELFIPINDIINIYQRLGYTVAQQDIEYCTWQMFTFFKAIERLGNFNWFSEHFTRISPFMSDQLETYHRGGLYDMAGQSALCWGGLAKSFESTSTENTTALCDILNFYIVNTTLSNITSTIRHSHQHSTAQLFELSEGGAERVLHGLGYHVQLEKRGDMLRVSEGTLDENRTSTDVEHTVEKMKRRLISVFDERQAESWSVGMLWRKLLKRTEIETLMQDELAAKRECTPVTGPEKPFLMLDIPSPYAWLGYSTVVGDFNKDGIKEIAMSAPFVSTNQTALTPHAGAVYILNAGDLALDLTRRPSHMDVTQRAMRTLYGQKPLGRFGYSMAVVDLNCDGIDDLAVSAPTSTGSDGNFTMLASRGEVTVYFGHASTGLSPIPDLVLELNEGLSNFSSNITGLGMTLRGEDVDNDGCRDLLVGWPLVTLRNFSGHYNASGNWERRNQHTGALLTFLSSSRHVGEKSPFDADWVLESPSRIPYEWFGMAMRRVQVPGMDHALLMVGAPAFGENGFGMTVGRVYFYNLTGSKAPPSLLLDVVGSEDFQQFGKSMEEVSSGIVAISSETETFYENELTWDAYLPSLFSMSLMHGYAPVISPFFTRAVWSAGSVRIFDLVPLLTLSETHDTLSLTFPTLTEGNGILLARLDGSVSGGRLGSSMTMRRQPSGVASLWISEPHASIESGVIYQRSLSDDNGAFFRQTNGRQLSVDEFSDGCLSYTDQDKAQFGKKLANLGDLDGDGIDELVITIPHGGMKRFSGRAIVLFG
ncbi:uncharacterized protein VTP21DRAFT_9303 [Calcarisporiella thermophila]|uniref:uncharacterized protein n=1 Tax=Calcarisporiella thermophila TaxID=911321 RepID=UPI003742F7AA